MKKALPYVVVSLVTLVLADKLKSFPVLNKLPSIG